MIKQTYLDKVVVYGDPQGQRIQSKKCDDLIRVFVYAGIAQLAVQLICNQQVDGSSPFAGSTLHNGFTTAR